MSAILRTALLLWTINLVAALTGKFVHLTDIHLDMAYVEGSDPKMLCHDGNGNAGPLGAVGTKCDSSPALVEKTFAFIKENLKDVDFVIYTGDSARHDRDDNLPRSEDNVIAEQKTVVNHFTKVFDISTTKVLPVIGNNDVHPHNSCEDTDKQFKTIESIWEPFGLNTTKAHFEKGGYFYEDVVPGKIRTIHTNTLMFFKHNKKSNGDCDKEGSMGSAHLKWMKDVLEESQAQGYKVYILAHIPPTSKKGKAYYTKACTDGYLDLLGTYKDTIIAHFAGHFNNDILSAVVKDGGKYKQMSALKKKKTIERKSLKSSEFITPLFNTPSIIPTFNPSIRVFHYEVKGTKEYPVGTIRDWEQYYLDLSSGSENFALEYRASDVFQVDAFDGEGVKKAFSLMMDNQKVHQQYMDHVTVNTDDNDSDDD
ncbi:Metallo-dependent phosphatase-like protein [Fennellomyces sp. T-0311]|nr:Metallo-dependent phosphatase-like protein [Fennellomyces sp. T-0311]